MGTLLGKTAYVFMFAALVNRGQLLKERIYSSRRSKFFPLKVDLFLDQCHQGRKNRKSQKLSTLKKMTETWRFTHTSWSGSQLSLSFCFSQVIRKVDPVTDHETHHPVVRTEVSPLIWMDTLAEKVNLTLAFFQPSQCLPTLLWQNLLPIWKDFLHQERVSISARLYPDIGISIGFTTKFFMWLARDCQVCYPVSNINFGSFMRIAFGAI